MISLFAIGDDEKPVEFILRQGEEKSIGAVTFGFETEHDTTVVIIFRENGYLMFTAPDTTAMLIMGQDTALKLTPYRPHILEERIIYQMGEAGFVLKKYFETASMKLVHADNPSNPLPDGVHLKISTGNTKKDIMITGRPGTVSEPVTATIEDVHLSISYGSLVHELPFAIFLKEFHLERYPGSNSPSSYASEVILVDEKNKVEKPYRIFMNKILKYGGYRFFQSSYDQDERGTILSVNYDAFGTGVTYAGYFLMTLGMVLTFFFPGTRFRKLASASARLKHKISFEKKFTATIVALILLFPLSTNATNGHKPIPKQHAEKFAKLQVQNIDGRIEPVNTLAAELLRKISGKNGYNGLTPVQVLLEMMTDPQDWQSKALIKVSNKELRKIIGIEGSHATFNDFLDSEQPNGYKLSRHIESAYAKAPAQRNKFDKEIVNIDERVNILYKMLSGGFLTLFPIPDAADNKWISVVDAQSHTDRNLAVIAYRLIQNYHQGLMQGKKGGNYTTAEEALNKVAEYQSIEGAAIYPSEFKTRLEIFYININLFSKLALGYIVLGLLLLLYRFILLLFPTLKTKRWIDKSGFWIVLSFFTAHTLGLAIRWYISGHAPWSNGYETLIYISWSACLAGLIFSRRSPITLAVTTVLAAISLLVAGMSWMSPELTNLVPVLKSYWLIIHVAVITASYGFLGMGALLAMVNLALITLRTSKNSLRIQLTIKELTYIAEMALIAGLYLLTIGSFLGGVWANESWGRYWGWDPKETWALVTILVYAFITHMHKIKGLRGEFAFSTAALLGFSSVLMTFFGVNYYLSGLHSYAHGDPPPIPTGVFVALGLVATLLLTAWMKERQWRKAELSHEEKNLTSLEN